MRARPTLEDGASARDAAAARRLARGFATLTGITFALIVLGALVRAHGAGLACPDWPLCFGELLPRLDFHLAFEVGHRALAGTVALLFAGLSAATLARPGLRAQAGRGIAGAAVLLALQVVLGGLTVLHLLAAWTVTAHLVTGNAFAATLLVISRRLAEAAAAAAPPRAPVTRALRGALVATGFVLVAQLVLGGLVSSHYAGLACPDWPSCRDGIFFPSFEGATGLQLAHRMTGYGLVAALGAVALSAGGAPRLARTARLAFALALVQVALGVANVLLRLPVEVTALHSAGAAGLVLLWTLAVREGFAAPLRTAAPDEATAALARAGG